MIIYDSSRVVQKKYSLAYEMLKMAPSVYFGLETGNYAEDYEKLKAYTKKLAKGMGINYRSEQRANYCKQMYIALNSRTHRNIVLQRTFTEQLRLFNY